MKTIFEKQRPFLLNSGLLLCFWMVVFNTLLPLYDEISLLNDELHAAEAKHRRVTSSFENDSHRPAGRSHPLLSIAAPEQAQGFSQVLEMLGRQHEAVLQAWEPLPKKTRAFPKYRIKGLSFQFSFEHLSLPRFAELLSDLEHKFPECRIQQFEYQQETGIAKFEILLLTTEQPVRFFPS